MTELIEPEQETLPLHAPGVMEALKTLRTAAEVAQNKENEAAEEHARKTQFLRGAIVKYNNHRRQAIEQEFERRQLTWCTYGKHVKHRSEIVLILCEGSYQESCGYERGDYRTVKYSDLHNACVACRETMTKQHGRCWKARYGNEMLHFDAHQAQKNNDGYQVDRGGGWRKLVREHSWQKPYKLPEMPWENFQSLAAEWKFPPLLGLECDILDHSHQIKEEFPKTYR